jgi:hypothetical protein
MDAPNCYFLTARIIILLLRLDISHLLKNDNQWIVYLGGALEIFRRRKSRPSPRYVRAARVFIFLLQDLRL